MLGPANDDNENKSQSISRHLVGMLGPDTLRQLFPIMNDDSEQNDYRESIDESQNVESCGASALQTRFTNYDKNGNKLPAAVIRAGTTKMLGGIIKSKNIRYNPYRRPDLMKNTNPLFDIPEQTTENTTKSPAMQHFAKAGSRSSYKSHAEWIEAFQNDPDGRINMQTGDHDKGCNINIQKQGGPNGQTQQFTTEVNQWGQNKKTKETEYQNCKVVCKNTGGANYEISQIEFNGHELDINDSQNLILAQSYLRQCSREMKEGQVPGSKDIFNRIKKRMEKLYKKPDQSIDSGKNVKLKDAPGPKR
ncbi:MAG: hypothetical protein U9N14_01040 [Pseudomonadota bacterium]|nr:hypothetical protein [Pseudomonadota bacterium]